MHLLVLSLICFKFSIIFQLESLLDVKKDLTPRVESTMEALANSRIDSAPVETLSTNKTAG